MSDEVKKITKSKVVEETVVELTIEISEKLFENIEKAKKEVADKRGYDVSYGEYIEEAFDDFLVMIDNLAKSNAELMKVVEYQNGLPQVVEREPEPGEKVEGEPPEPAPENMYGHISKDGKGDPMFQ